ncbi:putative 60S acidic ribosomal protein P3-like [Capsicum annuum]|nr:putative 60S acidic ribosomal protein P3-like [Capsicum annuum]
MFRVKIYLNHNVNSLRSNTNAVKLQHIFFPHNKYSTPTPHNTRLDLSIEFEGFGESLVIVHFVSRSTSLAGLVSSVVRSTGFGILPLGIGCLRNEAQCLSARQLRGHGVKRKAFEPCNRRSISHEVLASPWTSELRLVVVVLSRTLEVPSEAWWEDAGLVFCGSFGIGSGIKGVFYLRPLLVAWSCGKEYVKTYLLPCLPFLPELVAFPLGVSVLCFPVSQSLQYFSSWEMSRFANRSKWMTWPLWTLMVHLMFFCGLGIGNIFGLFCSDSSKMVMDQIPYVESATYVAYNNEKGRVICSLIKHGFIDLDSQVRGIPEWISAKAMVDSWLADATIYELWVGSDGTSAHKIYYSDLPWPLGKILNANDAFSALSTRLGEQAYFFDNRPISLGAVFFGHALFTLCALPDARTPVQVSDMGANLGVGSFMFKISRLGYESGYGYGCGASTKNDSNIYKWSYHEVTKVVPVNQTPKAK